VTGIGWWHLPNKPRVYRAGAFLFNFFSVTACFWVLCQSAIR